MRRRNRWMAILLVVAGLQLLACTRTPTDAASKTEPAKVERLEGGNLIRVRLSAKAAERLGIRTAPVRDEEGARKSGTPRKVIPYSAMLYDPDGRTWTYANPEPLIFVRRHIKIDSIRGDLAVLSEGPPSGTPVVTVGAAELFGIEFGVGK